MDSGRFALLRGCSFVQAGVFPGLSESPHCAGAAIDIRTFVYDTGFVNGREFVARASKYAKARGLEFSFDSERGKGSHGMVWVGRRSTIVKHGEIGKGLLAKMLRQLDVSREDF